MNGKFIGVRDVWKNSPRKQRKKSRVRIPVYVRRNRLLEPPSPSHRDVNFTLVPFPLRLM